MHEAQGKEEPLYPLPPPKVLFRPLLLVRHASLVSYGWALSSHPGDAQDSFIGQVLISSCAGQAPLGL